MRALYEYIVETNLDKYIPHKYDDEVKSALWDYVSGYTSAINDELRKGHKVPKLTELLDQVFTDEIDKGVDLYRTVDRNYLKNMYGITEDNIESFIGKNIINKGYMSTASEFTSPWGKTWQEYEVILHITTTKSYPCVRVNKVFTRDEIDCWDQYEVLLPRDTKLKIVGFKRVKGSKFNDNLFIETQIV